MEMNDILNGLNSCGDSCCDQDTDCGGFNNDTSGMNFGNGCGFGPGCGAGPGCGVSPAFGGCGFGSWIWILLILFYGGCGRNSFLGTGGYNNGYNNCCSCCCKKKDDCCCCSRNNNGTGGCSSYLFLLVILFLCNGNFPNNGISPFNNACNTACGFGC
ncbi:hypothetical protein [Clostridium weizhouense]|uniref:Chorion class high-cysteine HCB protein 13 n=1 Tax=Clostridium weizhouense TaxID=2859781 RepID=A0ABS7AKH0_9CLOT|nr:hypothetical protein [Clostridium weizhouense]MBW6409165.1 hypothetical protein [Clostridium weizhouense]